MMHLLRERARHHAVTTRFIAYIFIAWLVLYTLSSWIDLFQGFNIADVLIEYVQGLTIGAVAIIIIALPAWLLLTGILDLFGFPRVREAVAEKEDVVRSIWDEP